MPAFTRDIQNMRPTGTEESLGGQAQAQGNAEWLLMGTGLLSG